MKPYRFLEYFAIFAVLVTYLAVSFNTHTKSTIQSQVLGVNTYKTELLRGERTSLVAKPLIVGSADVPETVSAKAYLVKDKNSGLVLYSKNLNEAMPIASLTKLMTALVALETLDLTQELVITPEDISPVSPHLNFTTGESFVMQDLIFAMIVGSSNDATLALGNAISKKTGQSIESLMNKKAQELGMQNTSFANPTGFDDPLNFSTANDLSKLLSECLKHGLFEIVGKQKTYTLYNSQGKSYLIKATNKLIVNHADILAVKTGNSPEAKGAMITQVNINGNMVEILILGSGNRDSDTLILKDFVAKTVKWQNQQEIENDLLK